MTRIKSASAQALIGWTARTGFGTGIGVMGGEIFRYDPERVTFIPASNPGGALK